MNLTLQTNYQISESQKPKVAGKKYLQWCYAINLGCLMLSLSNAGEALSYTYGRSAGYGTIAVFGGRQRIVGFVLCKRCRN